MHVSGFAVVYQYLQSELKSRLNSENACYHSVKNLLSFCFHSKNIKNSYFALCFIWALNLVPHSKGRTYTEDTAEQGAEEDNWPKKDDVMEEWEKLLMRSFMIFTP